MISYKSNIDKMIHDLDKLDVDTETALKRGMVEGMHRFAAHIQQRQMSGRRSPMFGLNVQHGALRRSWHVRTLRDSGHNFGVALASSSKYARIHQFGGVITAKRAPYLVFKMHTSTQIFSKKGLRLKRPKSGFSWVRVKSVTIPKRLYVLESFQREGMTVLRRAMFQNVAKLKKVQGIQGQL